MTNVTQWLLAWFRMKDRVVADELAGDVNYFEAGLIDSIGVIDLIANIEETFEIRFSHEHFQERRFVTITGLAEIIDELRAQDMERP
jgi:D-alanine--poly(phosphoribitol) ligase subunit 2